MLGNLTAALKLEQEGVCVKKQLKVFVLGQCQIAQHCWFNTCWPITSLFLFNEAEIIDNMLNQQCWTI